MAIVYVLVKVETNERLDAMSLVCELSAALDNDNTYKGVNRAIVVDINNAAVQESLDGADLMPQHVETSGLYVTRATGLSRCQHSDDGQRRCVRPIGHVLDDEPNMHGHMYDGTRDSEPDMHGHWKPTATERYRGR